MELRTGKKFVEGLCCECGQRFAKWRSPKFFERPDRDQQFMERKTFVAKCENCARLTRHAQLLHSDNRNRDEDVQAVASGGPVPAYLIADGETEADVREFWMRAHRIQHARLLEMFGAEK